MIENNDLTWKLKEIKYISLGDKTHKELLLSKLILWENEKFLFKSKSPNFNDVFNEIENILSMEKKDLIN